MAIENFPELRRPRCLQKCVTCVALLLPFYLFFINSKSPHQSLLVYSAVTIDVDLFVILECWIHVAIGVDLFCDTWMLAPLIRIHLFVIGPYVIL